MIVDYGSRSVEGRFKVKVQGETLVKSTKFKVVQGNYNLFYIIFHQYYQKQKKSIKKNNNI